MITNPIDLISQASIDNIEGIKQALAEAREEGRREILREVAKVAEWATSDGYYGCAFCEGLYGKHSPNCLWLRAQAVK